MKKRFIVLGLGTLIGLFLLYSFYELFVDRANLREYQTMFQQLEHSQDTTLADSFKMKFSYYPATYADESIQSQCAYLVGEIRTYSGSWDELQAFYTGKMLSQADAANIYVGIFPIALIAENGSSPGFDIEPDYAYSPFEVDALSRLEGYYYFWGFPKGLGESGQEVYAVYIAPDCE